MLANDEHEGPPFGQSQRPCAAQIQKEDEQAVQQIPHQEINAEYNSQDLHVISVFTTVGL